MNDHPWLSFEIDINGQRTKFIADPVQLHAHIVSSVRKQLQGGIKAETPEEVKTKIRVVKTTIKAFLIAAGDIFLDFVYGAKNYQKRGKKDDIYEWYANAYVKAALDMALQGSLVLYAEGGTYGQEQPIIIRQVRPVSLAESSRGIDGSEGEGTLSDAEVASTARLV